MKVMFPEDFKNMIPQVPKEIHHELNTRDFLSTTDTVDREIIYRKSAPLFTLTVKFYIKRDQKYCEVNLFNNYSRHECRIYYMNLHRAELVIASRLANIDDTIFTPPDPPVR